MRGLYFNGSNIEYRTDLIKPVPTKNQSLIRITLASICSTDKEILKGYRPDFRGILGHEFTGIVEESPNKDLIGKRVVGEINENCGECIYCKTNRPHHCIRCLSPGINRDGCFTEYMALNTDLIHLIPDNVPDEVAILTEPLSAAFEILEQVDIPSGTDVGIIGDGRLALLVANVISLKKANITTVGHHDDKLKYFEKFGKTLKNADDESFEIVIDCTGSPLGLKDSLRMVRKKGTIVLKSTYKGETNINLSLLPVNEITIVGSRCGPFDKALDALKNNLITFPKSEFYDLGEYIKAFSSTDFKSGFRI